MVFFVGPRKRGGSLPSELEQQQEMAPCCPPVTACRDMQLEKCSDTVYLLSKELQQVAVLLLQFIFHFAEDDCLSVVC